MQLSYDELEGIKMYRCISLITVLSICMMQGTETDSRSTPDSSVASDARTLAIVPTKIRVNEKMLELCYEIRNGSARDVWILAGAGNSGVEASIFMDDDGRTLLVTERLDVPLRSFGDAFYGRYVRLPVGGVQSESIVIAIPVRPQYGWSGGPLEHAVEYGTRLALEIGYYTGDLPAMVRGILTKADNLRGAKTEGNLRTIGRWFGGLLHFNETNEALRARDDEILIPYTDRAFGGEQVLRGVVEGMHIPYEQKEDASTQHYPPDLTSCMRLEIHFRPSMLEYFFPYSSQQSLLSHTEKEHMQSGKGIVVENQEIVRAFSQEVSAGTYAGGAVRQRTVADITCYSGEKELTSFPIYNDESIVTEMKYRFVYSSGLRSLRSVTPLVEQLGLRIQCGENLQDLWSRLRLYEEAAKLLRRGLWRGRERRPYPRSDIWCDSMLRAYQATGMSNEHIVRALMCPGVPGGKCHYAMNADCERSSPPDTVLLFETRAGRNQHGGPELFTFDNHEPKGGLVLLNDGTVKFIRTEEELKQLRWK